MARSCRLFLGFWRAGAAPVHGGLLLRWWCGWSWRAGAAATGRSRGRELDVAGVSGHRRESIAYGSRRHARTRGRGRIEPRTARDDVVRRCRRRRPKTDGRQGLDRLTLSNGSSDSGPPIQPDLMDHKWSPSG